MLYTVFDVETSGLERGCDVLSFAYALTDENVGVKRAEVLYFWKEGVTKWTEEAYEINHLSKEFLRQYEADYEKNLQKMYIVLSMGHLVGFNSGYINKNGDIAGFDYQVCCNFLERNNFPRPIAAGFVDLMRVYQSHHAGFRAKLTKVFKEYKLSEDLAGIICQVYFNDTAKEAHFASYDVAMTILLLSEFADRGWIAEKETDTVDYSEEEPEIEQTDYKLFFDEKCDLQVRLTDGKTVVPLADFMNQNPAKAQELIDKMLQ